MLRSRTTTRGGLTRYGPSRNTQAFDQSMKEKTLYIETYKSRTGRWRQTLHTSRVITPCRTSATCVASRTGGVVRNSVTSSSQYAIARSQLRALVTCGSKGTGVIREGMCKYFILVFPRHNAGEENVAGYIKETMNFCQLFSHEVLNYRRSSFAMVEDHSFNLLAQVHPSSW
jgi:hypothetical protein